MSSYIFKGRLCGFLCEKCQEPLAQVAVRLYRMASETDALKRAVAEPKETFAILTDDEVERKTSLLLAETLADDEGRFTFELDEQQYDGGPFEVDVYCDTVPRPRTGRGARPLQFSVTTLQPRWRTTEAGSVAVWDYCLSARYWCLILARFGVWSICGRFTACQGGTPIPGAVITAFDADWIQDDPLGSATTDATGQFLISYTTDDFEKTPFSPLINLSTFAVHAAARAQACWTSRIC